MPTRSGDAPVQLRISPGRPLPLGVHDCCDGFNFAVFSRHAEKVELLIFEAPTSPEPIAAFDLDPAVHRTGDIWHALVDGVEFGQAYAYKAHGPWAPAQGHRFKGDAVLLDPYGLSISPIDEDAESGSRSVLVHRRFDWQGTARPRTPWSQTVIYETHVRGLTIHPSARAAHPGTFLGVIEKIPYFRDLGITALELMPVQAFRTQAGGGSADERALRNYWGYDPIAAFSPHPGYASGGSTPGGELAQFKTMVRELHRADIEVILDVVFNHTGEGGASGPVFSFRGLDNAIYYMLSPDKHEYLDFTGCGNTLNCNHPVVRDYIIDCLRYWATEAQIDGFRFDLAAILGRDEQGRLSSNAPLLERIAEDPILRQVKLIAEAWDMGGAYELGEFSGQRWAELNGRFRDDVRRFWRGDAGQTGAFASRLCGSADLFQRSGKSPVNSINFITSHDGFTLNDLVTYGRKHNEANGEGSRDGADENYTCNYGVEGRSEDQQIEEKRRRRIKSMIATLLLSRGVPMILGGDEFRRTQVGNNNAYDQDNEISWYDWRLLQSNEEIFRFAREAIALRRRHPVLSEEAFYAAGDLEWFGPSGRGPDWDGPTRALGCLVRTVPADDACARPGALCLLFNASEARLEFELPASGSDWRVALDTGRAAPDDVFSSGAEPLAAKERQYGLGAGALAVLCND